MIPGFMDTHCHYDFPPFAENEAQGLALAEQAGVRRILVPATAAIYFARVIALAQRWPALFAALGLHPIEIEHHDDEALAQLDACLAQRSNKLIAVGEIGLDLYIDNPRFTRQQAILDAQLGLAKRYDLPVLLHSRRTHDKLAWHLKRAALPRTGVVHGFSGSLQQAERFIGLGFYIGVGGVITWPRARKTRDVIARLPLTALLLETDAPDMPLCGRQGQPNRPEYLVEIFNTLCELRPEAPEAIAQALWENSCRLFHLPA
ncbi:TatD family hydrolase [Erwinia sp. HR93]|nr:TatD family hydrolase [Erwinia sp. HR93]MEA1063507.1 TatD family hydrolase [Erwinia sp. HR93]